LSFKFKTQRCLYDGLASGSSKLLIYLNAVGTKFCDANSQNMRYKPNRFYATLIVKLFVSSEHP